MIVPSARASAISYGGYFGYPRNVSALTDAAPTFGPEQAVIGIYALALAGGLTAGEFDGLPVDQRNTITAEATRLRNTPAPAWPHSMPALVYVLDRLASLVPFPLDTQDQTSLTWRTFRDALHNDLAKAGVAEPTPEELAKWQAGVEQKQAQTEAKVALANAKRLLVRGHLVLQQLRQMQDPYRANLPERANDYAVAAGLVYGLDLDSPIAQTFVDVWWQRIADEWGGGDVSLAIVNQRAEIDRIVEEMRVATVGQFTAEELELLMEGGWAPPGTTNGGDLLPMPDQIIAPTLPAKPIPTVWIVGGVLALLAVLLLRRRKA